MSISSHLGIIILVIVGAVTIFGVIIIAAVEARCTDSEKPPTPQQTATASTDKEKKRS